MRRITRNFVIGLFGVIVALLALGALPSYLASGAPYYVEAEAVNTTGPSVNGSVLDDQRFPYTAEAIADGRSEGYQRGPIGAKESFAHTPFDEFEEFEQRNPDAANESVAYVSINETRYRLTVARGR